MSCLSLLQSLARRKLTLLRKEEWWIGCRKVGSRVSNQPMREVHHRIWIHKTNIPWKQHETGSDNDIYIMTNLFLSIVR